MHVLRRPTALAAALLLALVATLVARSEGQVTLAQLVTDAPHAFGVLVSTAGSTFGSFAGRATITGLFATIVLLWLAIVMIAVDERRAAEDKPRYDIR